MSDEFEFFNNDRNIEREREGERESTQFRCVCVCVLYKIHTYIESVRERERERERESIPLSGMLLTTWGCTSTAGISPAPGSRPIVAYAHSVLATPCALNVPASASARPSSALIIPARAPAPSSALGRRALVPDAHALSVGLLLGEGAVLLQLLDALELLAVLRRGPLQALQRARARLLL